MGERNKEISSQIFPQVVGSYVIARLGNPLILVTDSTKITRPGRGITYLCTEQIFDSRLLMYNYLFLEKLL